jgi:hypothetical protein
MRANSISLVSPTSGQTLKSKFGMNLARPASQSSGESFFEWNKTAGIEFNSNKVIFNNSNF